MATSKEKYKIYTLRNFNTIPQIQQTLTDEEKRHIEVVGNILPFKVNDYVINELIDWNNIPNDPIYQLTFSQKGMLATKHYNTVRGPNMSASPEKIQILRLNKIKEEKVFPLKFIQGRNPEWTGKPFFARYNPDAIWLDDLQPAFGRESFFFEGIHIAASVN
jgi:hypothetical protein